MPLAFLKVGLMQLHFGTQLLEAPFEKILLKARELSIENELDLLVLPELWTASTHSPDVILSRQLDLSRFQTVTDEIMRGATTALVLGSFPLMTPYGIRNTAIYRSLDGEWKTNLYKAVPFGFGKGESSVISPSDSVNGIEIGGVTAQVRVCFDLRFPELFRVLSPPPMIYVLVASWPLSRIDLWEKLLIARAIENQSWVIATNGSGDDLGLSLGGRSMIISPEGRVNLSLEANEEYGDFRINIDEVEHLRSVFPVNAYRPKTKVQAPKLWKNILP